SPDDGDTPNSPLDDLFVVGARYHEPTAAERDRAARDARKQAERDEKERQKRVRHTRRVLGGDTRRAPSADYDRRVALIGLGVSLGCAVLRSFTAFGH